MQKRTQCSHCGKFSLVESMIQGGYYECLECGNIEIDDEDYDMMERFEDLDSFREYIYLYNQYDYYRYK